MSTKLLVVLVLTLTVVTVSGRSRQRRQLFDGAYETSQVATLLKNAAFVRTQAKCAMATEAQATAICDRIGRLIRKNIPNAIKTLECPGNCTNKEKKTIAVAYDIMVTDYPDIWEKLLTHFKVSPEQKLALTKFMDEIRKLPDT